MTAAGSENGATPSHDDLVQTLGAVLGRTPSGVYILTARNAAGRETGLLASWVQQVSFEPPMVTVAVNQKRFLHDWLAEYPTLVLNLLAEGQKQFLKHFGAGFGPDEEAFAGVALGRTRRGLPYLAEALGYLEVEIHDQLATGDHVIYAARVVGAGQGPEFEQSKPWIHLRKSGFHY